VSGPRKWGDPVTHRVLLLRGGDQPKSLGVIRRTQPSGLRGLHTDMSDSRKSSHRAGSEFFALVSGPGTAVSTRAGPRRPPASASPTPSDRIRGGVAASSWRRPFRPSVRPRIGVDRFPRRRERRRLDRVFAVCMYRHRSARSVRTYIQSPLLISTSATAVCTSPSPTARSRERRKKRKEKRNITHSEEAKAKN